METVEKQYRVVFDTLKRTGRSKFGLMANESWNNDPRRTLFTLARYKFVSKMMSGLDKVLEVGCADAFGSRVVAQTVGSLSAVDFDPVFVEDARSNISKNWPIDIHEHNMLTGPFLENFDGLYSLDVLEHIAKNDEGIFLQNCCDSISETGVLIVGMPSLESQEYASPQSLEGHVNCKSGEELKCCLKHYFNNVFLFSMNDEVVHTGFSKMAHYVICVCTSKKGKLCT